MSSTLPKSGYVPLELAAGAFLSLGEGLADLHMIVSVDS